MTTSSNNMLYARPTIEWGPNIRTTYDTSKCYVVGLLRDNSKAMLATFIPDTKDPFARIQAWLEENFNPGASAAAKDNGADIFLIMTGPTQDEKSRAIARGYLGMLDNIVIFRVAGSGILTPEHSNFVNGAVLMLNVEPKSPLIVGDRASLLGRAA